MMMMMMRCNDARDFILNEEAHKMMGLLMMGHHRATTTKRNKACPVKKKKRWWFISYSAIGCTRLVKVSSVVRSEGGRNSGRSHWIVTSSSSSFSQSMKSSHHTT